MVRMGQRFCEFTEEGFGAGVGVGLEYAPQFFVGIVLRRFQGGFDLGRMMGIIIDHRHTVKFSFILKTAVCAGERAKPFLCGIHGDAEQIRHRDGREGVGYVVVACHGQDDMVRMLAVFQEIKCDASVFIIGHVPGAVVGTGRGSVGNDIAFQSVINRLVIVDIAVDDQCAVRRRSSANCRKEWRMSSRSLKKSR